MLLLMHKSTNKIVGLPITTGKLFEIYQFVILSVSISISRQEIPHSQMACFTHTEKISVYWHGVSKPGNINVNKCFSFKI